MQQQFATVLTGRVVHWRKLEASLGRSENIKHYALHASEGCSCMQGCGFAAELGRWHISGMARH